MVWIVYKTTNKINEKIYVGVHKTSEPNIFDGYLGSGNFITEAIRKYGKENFFRETLFVFDSEKDAEEKESELVNQEFIDREDTYNITLGGNLPPKNGSSPPNHSGSRWIHRGKRNRKIPAGTPVPKGWKYGRNFVFSEGELALRRDRLVERNIKNNPMKNLDSIDKMTNTVRGQFSSGRTPHNKGKKLSMKDGIKKYIHMRTQDAN